MGQAWKILVCDDDQLVVDLMEYRLRAKGYDVVTAKDGEESLKKAAETQPDLIVLDAMMPKLNGFQTLSRLKADAGLQDIPVIMLTARKGESDIVSALNAGAEDYLVKPFIPDELMTRLSKALGARRKEM